MVIKIIILYGNGNGYGNDEVAGKITLRER